MRLQDCLYYDLETTDANAEGCAIVEFCFVSDGEVWAQRVKPWKPISKEAELVHGISPDDVASELAFADYAVQVQELINDRVLVGFNSIRFDSIVLDAELQRAGFPGLEKDNNGIICHPEIDLMALWNNFEKRSLVSAARRFAGIDLEDAHQAKADTEVLPMVLKGMIGQLQLDGMDLIKASIPPDAVDREGKFVKDEDGTIVFNFGKHKGQPVHSNRQYLTWMVGASFSSEVKAYARRFLKE